MGTEQVPTGASTRAASGPETPVGETVGVATQFPATVRSLPAPITDSRPPSGVEIELRNGIWSVTVDGNFLGDYHAQEDAEAAATLERRQS